MKALRLLALCALPAAALDNSITIRNNYTGTLTNHPAWFGRWFARGEIGDFCRPYATPSDTAARSAVSEWQCDVKNRWRDATAVRAIAGVRTESPAWSNGAGLVSIVVSNDIGTMTTSIPHGLAIGDRLVLTGSPTDGDLMKDNFIVHEVTSSTVAKFITRFVTNGTYMTNVTVTQAIDPMNPSGLRYYSANHGFYKGEKVTIAGVTGVADANGTFTITAVTRDEFVVNETGSGTYTGGGTATGPDNGSVRFALVALKTTIPASGSTRIDFVSDPNPSSAGDAGATFATALDKGEMLSAAWEAQLEATANVKAGSLATISTNARAMLNSWNEAQTYCGPRYWAAGPVLTWFILEYGCSGALTYDFGWKIGTGTTTTMAVSTTSQNQFTVNSLADIEIGTRLWFVVGSRQVEVMTVTAINPAAKLLTVTRNSVPGGVPGTYASGKQVGILQWQDAPDGNYKSIHPAFHLRFANGWNGVGERFEVKNEYWGKMQNLWYSAELKTGTGPAARVSIPEVKHPNRTSWKIDTWDGNDPEFYCAGGSGTDAENCPTTGGGTRARKYWIDHNTPYLMYAKALPEWRLFSGTTMAPYDTRFAKSDKGALGVSRSDPAKAYYLGSGWPGNYLGGGTYGQPFTTPVAHAEYGFSGAEETGLLEYTQALWLQNWSLAGYEINFGDSVPGGAGNVEAQNHITWHNVEDDAAIPRPFMAGFSEPAFGRPLSIYARPAHVSHDAQMLNTASPPIDRPRSACSTSPAPAAPSATVSEWPCYHFGTSMGQDNWGIDNTHQNDGQNLSYLITADPRYLDTIVRQAQWNLGGEQAYRNLGKSWSQPEADRAIRQQGGWTRAVMNAALYTPNTPQFGDNAPPVEAYYWNEKLWETGYSKEGFLGIQNGHFAEHYPETFAASCTGHAAFQPSIWNHTRCASRLGNNRPNALGWPTHVSVNSCSSNPYLKCTPNENTTWYMWHHLISQWERAESMGLPMFQHSIRKVGDLMLSLIGSSNFNPFLVGTYHNPLMGNDVFYTTIADVFNQGYAEDWLFNKTDAASTMTRQLQTFNYIVGSSTVRPEGFATQWRGSIPMLAELNIKGTADGCSASSRIPDGCTWTNAYSWISSVLPSQNAYPSNPKVAFVPRATISDVKVDAGGTTAILRYRAPTGDACRYYVGMPEPDNTLDTGDTSDGGGPRPRSVVVTGLTAAAEYRFRLTCGPRLGPSVNGTTRTAGSFTTGVEGGATTFALNIGAVSGATQVVVEYGDTESLGNSLAPIECPSDCSAGVPATGGKLLYYRLTHRNDPGTVISQGKAVAVIP